MIVSPCTQLCTIDRATGLCLGCARTLDEIAAWSACDDATKAAILARVAARSMDGSATRAEPASP